MSAKQRDVHDMLQLFPHLLELYPLERFLGAALAEAAALAGGPASCYVPASSLLACRAAGGGVSLRWLTEKENAALSVDLAGGTTGRVETPLDLRGKKTVPCSVLSRPTGYLILPRAPGAIPKLRLLSRLMGYYLQRNEVEKAFEGAGRSLVIMGCCPTIFEVQESVERYAPTREPVLLNGETGSGKEIIAFALHALSSRRQGPFVSVNCAAAADQNLLKDEFFGHRKGAFTGALSDRQGHMQEAHGGTLFLDEISEMSLELQGMLLRALATGEVRRLGDQRPSRVDVRLVSATNKDVRPGSAHALRADLYYRISALAINLPALRERPGDIAFLSDYILYRFATENGLPEKRLSGQAKERLLGHSWPGNVRELENVAKRAFMDAPGTVIEERHIRFEEPSFMAPSLAEDMAGRVAKGDMDFWEAVYQPFMRREMTKAELAGIMNRAIRRAGGSVKGAASLLNVKGKDYPRFVSFLHRHGFRGKKKPKE